MRRVDVLVALLLGILGFAVVVQVHSTQQTGVLANARPEDLVQILDELSNRSDRLRQEISSLTATKQRLTTGTGATEAALAEARKRTLQLGILAGTVPASGPGIQLRITDPKDEVSASVLLDVLEELRNAGAEAIAFEGTGDNGRVRAVRIVAQSAFTDRDTGVSVDGVHLLAPFRFTAIGDPSTLAGAMAIPGGVDDAVRQQGGSTQVTREGRVRIGALRVLATPRYARPD
jgi:uncharacterized protein YlxW (UPF0749 family)